ncbi:hypothetical protein GCM10011519_14110 [Marmoricola endophyticus]|uniref:Uncharacterized protein n=1 Tax=Marmoricola endophyticus TaxID=2040280 RepID=A0A917F4C6_9ACTN|nr:hypothetical protein [Marmoricola endophyticus]GGF41484.1 hypothetical protein GCM10011519_14110 [Marmoricola endophyticus]
MEILLWLVPAVLVTLLAAWGAAVAARREEARRVELERARPAPAAPEPTYDEDGGVSAPRPARRPAEQPDTDERGHGDRHRRSA